jgi:hypothetical protein
LEVAVIEIVPLIRATIVGTVLQLTLYVTGHFIPWLAQHLFLFGGMMISATSAYIYAVVTGQGWFASATAGAIAGGVCGFVGIGFSAFLGDIYVSFIPTGTTIAVGVGAVGGLFGQMAANLRAMGY